MKGFVYLDYNATTPIDPRVAEVVDRTQRDVYGNPASVHGAGAAARQAVELAREQVASLIGARPPEIVFTSGATESDNLALMGAVGARTGRQHLVTVSTEHKAVLDATAALAMRGHSVTVLDVDSHGRVDPSDVADALRPETAIVSVMAANNELGTLAPLEDIGAACRAAGVSFHTDAAQLVGKLPVKVDEAHADLLSLSGHKFYGPKGVGALYVRRGTPLEPVMRGGGHERGFRSGTLNVPGIVGLGMAAVIAADEWEEHARRSEQLRAELLVRLRNAFQGLEVNGHPVHRLPGTLNVRLPGIDSDSLQAAAPMLAASSGSACTSATPEPSYVLRAIGRSWDEASECLRLSIGRVTTEDEVHAAVALLRAGADRLQTDLVGSL